MDKTFYSVFKRGKNTSKVFLIPSFLNENTSNLYKHNFSDSMSFYLLIPMHRGRMLMYLDLLIGDLTSTLT